MNVQIYVVYLQNLFKKTQKLVTFYLIMMARLSKTNVLL